MPTTDCSVTGLGYFPTILVTKFLSKVVLIFGNILGNGRKCHFKIGSDVATIWATFGKIGLFSI